MTLDSEVLPVKYGSVHLKLTHSVATATKQDESALVEASVTSRKELVTASTVSLGRPARRRVGSSEHSHVVKGIDDPQ